MTDPTILSAEQEMVKLSAKLDEMKTSLAQEAEAARGKVREDLLGEVAKVTARLDEIGVQLTAIERDKMPGLEVVDPKKHMTEHDMEEKFSLFRHLKVVAKYNVPNSPVSLDDCGYEIEALNQMSLKKKGATAFEVIQHASQNVGQDSAGGVFVPQEVSSSMIPELVASTVAGRAGVQMLTGLVGDMSWPKKLSGVAGQWLDTEAEQAITTETLVFGSVRATPHPYAAAVPITWLALRQPAISMEAVVRQDLNEKLGLLLDLGAIKGTGQNGQPRGIDNWPGLGTNAWTNAVFGSTAGTGGLVTYDTSLNELRAHHQDLRSANAVGDGRSIAWIAEPNVLTKLESAKDANGRGMYLTDQDIEIQRLLRAPVYYSTAMTNSDTADGFLLYGKFNEAILAMWGGLEFAISDSHSTNFLTGVVVIRAIGSADVVVRQPLAFSSATAFTTT